LLVLVLYTLNYRMSQKSIINGNFNYFSYFFYRLKLKVKRLKMALTLDERVEIVLLTKWSSGMVYAVKI
jgi:hypothetical protein